RAPPDADGPRRGGRRPPEERTGRRGRRWGRAPGPAIRLVGRRRAQRRRSPSRRPRPVVPRGEAPFVGGRGGAGRGGAAGRGDPRAALRATPPPPARPGGPG